MKLNLKSTIAAPAGHKSLNGIIGNTRRGIVVDKTLDPDSNNPVANKPVSTALAALAGKIDAALQKPTGLTKTKLVGVGASGQENIEIGDNLTLANGKLAATGGSVSPTLNLIDFESGEIRTSITEEEYNNLKNGLYNSVNYYTEVEYDTYLPSKLVSVYDDSDESLVCIFSSIKITGTSETDISSTNIIYQLNIGQKDTSGNYPITIEEVFEIPFGSSIGGDSVSPRLNLMNDDLSAVRTSITEEEKNNIAKGLYHSVLYIDTSLGEAASISSRLPENAFHSNVNGAFCFSVYKVDSNNSITGARLYELRIGEQGSDETYPITVSKITDLPFGGDNLLQKPSRLTKTELVGVGANGQENIEIGDNLTLANGKLSATVGGSGGDNVVTININDSNEEITAKYSDVLMNLKPWFCFNYLISPQEDRDTGSSLSYVMFNPETKKLQYISVIPNIDELAETVTFSTNSISLDYIKQLYYHFITLTSNTSTFYLTYQNTSNEQLINLDSLKTALAGKYLLCTGHTDSDTAEYISGERGNVIVGVVDNSDHSTSGITIDSSYTITDNVTPVE